MHAIHMAAIVQDGVGDIDTDFDLLAIKDWYARNCRTRKAALLAIVLTSGNVSIPLG